MGYISNCRLEEPPDAYVQGCVKRLIVVFIWPPPTPKGEYIPLNLKFSVNNFTNFNSTEYTPL